MADPLVKDWREAWKAEVHEVERWKMIADDLAEALREAMRQTSGGSPEWERWRAVLTIWQTARYDGVES